MIITLTTDFGLTDGYVGTMKGVLLSLSPRSTLVDVSHLVPAHNVLEAAFAVYQAAPVFPPDSIHLAVVDPGVGGDRRALAVRTDWGTFVAPDNGLLTLILTSTRVHEMVSLTNPAYWREPVSSTFHGRDLFAPAAAHLANGVALSHLGTSITDPVRLPRLAPDTTSPDGIVAHVLHVDHFGNLVLDIQASGLPGHPVFDVAGKTITGLRRTYSKSGGHELIAYVGSTHDHVEIAAPQGQAARLTGASAGTPVLITSEDT